MQNQIYFIKEIETCFIFQISIYHVLDILCFYICHMHYVMSNNKQSTN